MAEYKHKYILCPICQKHKFPVIVDYTCCPYCGWCHDDVSEECIDIAIGPNSLSLNDFKIRYLKKLEQNPGFYYKRDGYPEDDEEQQ